MRTRFPSDVAVSTCTAALLPLAAWAAAVVMAGGASHGVWPARQLLRDLTGDALLNTTILAVVGAPLFGVALATSNRAAGVGHLVARMLAGIGAFVAMSGALTLLGPGPAPEALGFVAASHATLAAAAFGLAALGAAAGAMTRDPLDAAAISLTTALIASAGVLVAGNIVADAPRRLVELALLASPLTATTSAAHVDLAHMEPLYQISPLAHLTIDYPSWYAACAWHTGVAVACLVTLIWSRRTWHPRGAL